MMMAFAGAGIAVVLLAAWSARARSGLRAALALVLALAGMTVFASARVAEAAGSTLFVQSFANNTVDTTYPVALPAPSSGSNAACLTASGNSGTGVLHSCPANNDAPGSGKLRLTAASSQQQGGVLSATSLPTSQGIDAKFNTYQYGGTGADGIGFVLAAVNPAAPLSPPTMGPPGGSLGYSASGGKSGLAE